MKLKTVIAIISFTASVSSALADAPVVDLSQSNNTTNGGNQQQAVTVPYTASSSDSSTLQQSLSMDQRVAKLENQMNNLANMNVAAQIDQLQQQLQQLQGQLQVAQHDLKTLDEQQRNFYQDLDQRLNNLKALVDNDNTPVSNAATKTKLNNLNKKTSAAPAAPASASAAISAVSNQTAVPSDQQQAYDTAFAALKNKDYQQAADSFQNFLADYPNSSLSANVHYWLGEIYYQQGDKEKAANELQTVIKQYPASHKVPDAMLKYAYVLRDDGQYQQALSELKKIRSKFPGSAAARLANLQVTAIHKQMQTAANSTAQGVDSSANTDDLSSTE